jgi:hypothetical protein
VQHCSTARRPLPLSDQHRTQRYSHASVHVSNQLRVASVTAIAALVIVGATVVEAASAANHVARRHHLAGRAWTAPGT